MSKRKTKVSQPHFLRKLVYLRRMGVLPDGVAKVDVYHDAWCAHFQGQACNCEPEIQVPWTQPVVAQN